ncbi:hypothetical protein [Halosegnis marinus]|uniref:DUF8006 domain-containing protein n=1 Tax=Halosegnis marinus TaxID=3034023 RepID=A0ABD5ZM58_9EURY|nr:hypothetical protein [Halosegnis sp. DT85]
MFALPLQVVDNFLLQFDAGQVILALFVLSTLAALPLKSLKIVGLNAIVFGLIFMLTPGSLAPIHFRFLGIALVFVGPLLVISARQ